MEKTISQKLNPMARENYKAAVYLRVGSVHQLDDGNAVKPKTGKAAIYCRTASKHPNDFMAILFQRDKVRAFALQQGYNVCEEYWDDGYSGNDLQRPSFLKMMDDISSGKVDTVIVNSADRIARNYFLLNDCLGNFKSQGVKLIAVDGSHAFMPLANNIELVRSMASMVKSR